MDTARIAAPHIDRLVLSVYRRVGPTHGARLHEQAQAIGLNGLDLLAPIADFLLAGVLTRELLAIRLRYRPDDVVRARIDELTGAKLIAEGPAGFEPSPAMAALLTAMIDARAAVAADTWRGHEDDVAIVSSTARHIGDTTSDDHVMAALHSEMAEPADPYLRLEHHLVTLRLIRQHDHAAAWLNRDLTAPQVVALTDLWHGVTTDPAPEVVVELVAAGLVSPDPLRLTPDGRSARQAIEAETDHRSQASFDVLDGSAATVFLGALERLPGTLP